MKKTALLLGIIIFVMAGVAGATPFQSIAPISGSGYHINGGGSYSYAFDTPLSFTTPYDTLVSANLVLTGTPDDRFGSGSVTVGNTSFGALNPISTNGVVRTYSYDLTSLFTTWTGGNDNLPLLLRISDSHGNKDGFTLTSAAVYIEYSEPVILNKTPDQGSAPVPEPATLLLLGSGFAGLSFWGKKRTKV